MNIKENIRTDIQEACCENRRFLETDSICTSCGAIINSYYEDQCILCSCGGEDFVSGQIVIDIRTLLEMRLIELKILCVVYDITLGSRAKMVYGVIKKLHGFDSRNEKNNKINETLIRKTIIRKRPAFWFVKEIEKLIHKS